MNQNCPQIKEQYQQLFELKQEFERVFDSKDLKGSEKLMKELKSKFEELWDSIGIYRTTVDYSKSIEEMARLGKYDWKNDEINDSNFLPEIKSESKINFRLLSLSKETKFDEILAELDKQGLRPATLQELLAFGAVHPNKQLEFEIIALGSIWPAGDNRNGAVPSLYSFKLKRLLSLYHIYGPWGSDVRFLAVPK